MSLDEQKY